jgi:hypothetical protein
VEIAEDLPYILAFQPKRILFRIGPNDVGSSIWSPTNYQNMVTLATNAGVHCWELCAQPEGATGGTTYPQVNTFLMTNYPTTTIPVFDWNPATMESADQFHPNPFGYQQIAHDCGAVVGEFGGKFNH